MFYTGYTANLEVRMTSHQAGKVASTRHRLPLKLIYIEGCLNQQDATRREKYLKSGSDYVDVHAWYFTPDTFATIVNELHEADVSPFLVERIYPTLFQTLEFWVVLKKS